MQNTCMCCLGNLIVVLVALGGGSNGRDVGDINARARQIAVVLEMHLDELHTVCSKLQ